MSERGNWLDSNSKQQTKKVFTVLAIDGGGVRGIIPARILHEIEKRTGRPIADLFDMVGGSSTGAIIGGCLVAPDPKNPAKPRFSAKDIYGFYHKLAGQIFPSRNLKMFRKFVPGALYSAKPLEEKLLECFGDFRMKDALTSFLIPATDIKNFRPVWITHLKGQVDRSKEGWGSMLIRDAVRATTSAPTYFPAKYYYTTPNPTMPDVKARHALIDGSFFGGNAPQRLYNEAKKLAPPDAEIIVVHLGTGNTNNKMSPEEFNDLSVLGLLNKSNGSVLLSLVAKMSVLDTAEDMREEIGDRFYTFDGILQLDGEDRAPASAMAIDDARPENLQRLEKMAGQIIRDNDAEINRLCDILRDHSCHPLALVQAPLQPSKPAHKSILDSIKETSRDMADQAKSALRKAFGKDRKPPPGGNDGTPDSGSVKNDPKNPPKL